MKPPRIAAAMEALDDDLISGAVTYVPARVVRRNRIVLLAACIAALLALCGFGYAAAHFWGIGSAKPSDFDDLADPFGTLAGDRDTQAEAPTCYVKSDLITDYTNVYADNAVCVELQDNRIPAIYFSPNYMAIFTQDAEAGWSLSKGEEVTFRFSLYEPLQLEVGYVLNGRYYKVTSGMGPDFEHTICAPEDGSYFFCLTNRSSSNAILTDGIIQKQS